MSPEAAFGFKTSGGMPPRGCVWLQDGWAKAFRGRVCLQDKWRSVCAVRLYLAAARPHLCDIKKNGALVLCLVVGLLICRDLYQRQNRMDDDILRQIKDLTEGDLPSQP